LEFGFVGGGGGVSAAPRRFMTDNKPAAGNATKAILANSRRVWVEGSMGILGL